MSGDLRLSPQEFLGVLATRLAHRLSNYASVAAGNLAIHDLPQSSEQDRSAALAGIREATRQSGVLLDRFTELARSLRPRENSCELLELFGLFADWIYQRPTWTMEIAPELSKWEQRAMVGPWKWLAFALDAIAEGSRSGTLKAQSASAPPGPPLLETMPVAYVAIIVTSNGTDLIHWHEHREQMKSWTLAAAYEFLQYLGVRPTSQSLPTGETQTTLIIPLISR